MRQRRGVVAIFVLIAAAIAVVGGLVLLLGATTAGGAAIVISDHAQARQAAESGLSIGTAYLERTPGWRAERTPGTWVTDQQLLGCSLTLIGDFEEFPTPPIELIDPSFETETAILATPLLNPPMSGVIGGWLVQRTALVQTGLTVPRIGTRAAAGATDGVNQAFIGFGASVTGSGVFSQTLSESLWANTSYVLTIDIDTAGLPPLDSSFGFRLYAGPTLVVSTEEALDITDILNPILEDVQGSAEDLLDNAQEPATLVRTLLGGSTSAYTLSFSTGDDPPPGQVRVELFAESTGLISTVAFDHLRLDAFNNDPVSLTAIGRKARASHAVSAVLVRDLSGTYRVLEWAE